MSRSRSRVPMDWRPASRSRSRPPMSGIPSEHQNQFKFPTSSPSPKPLSSSPSIPIPGASSSLGRRSPPLTVPSHSGLPSLYESAAETPLPPFSQMHPYSALNSPAPHPSSLPSFGLRGFPRASLSSATSPEQRTFPKHVRKTSFDHTVAREGIFTGVSGRHQVNGKPLSPESILGTKRRADAPHAESMLRGDPPAVDASLSLDTSDLGRSNSPFPSGAFNFSYPTSHYDAYFDLPASTNPLTSHLPPLSNPHKQQNDLPYHESLRSSLNGAYSPIGSSNEGLSAAAAAASAAVAEGYAQLNVANLAGLDEPGLDFQQFMGMVYPGLDNSSSLGQNPYTHVDPTQILPLDHSDALSQTFHPSPSSDGWGNGVGSSSNASPEPYNTSNASTPPSADGQANNTPTNSNTRNNAPPPPRKIITTRRISQDNVPRSATALTQRKRYGVISAVERGYMSLMMINSTTPDLTPGGSGQSGKSGNEDGEQSPTVCTNCQTTNTPLWRRDPEGQPLCTCFFFLFLYGFGVFGSHPLICCSLDLLFLMTDEVFLR